MQKTLCNVMRIYTLTFLHIFFFHRYIFSILGERGEDATVAGILAFRTGDAFGLLYLLTASGTCRLSALGLVSTRVLNLRIGWGDYL